MQHQKFLDATQSLHPVRNKNGLFRGDELDAIKEIPRNEDKKETPRNHIAPGQSMNFRALSIGHKPSYHMAGGTGGLVTQHSNNGIHKLVPEVNGESISYDEVSIHSEGENRAKSLY